MNKLTIKERIEVTIPELVAKKIKLTCSVIEEVEWSGILLYTLEGSFRDIKSIKITVQDFILMNRGTAAFTSFDLNEKEKARDTSGFEDMHIDYVQEDPANRLKYKMGLIHSHNNMEVFFSGTDQTELIDNSKSHNYYLSLIVNNKFDICAKIGIYSKQEVIHNSKSLPINTGEGDFLNFNYKSKEKFIIEKFIEIDCNIVKNAPTLEIDDFFLKGLNSIVKVKSYIPPAYPNHYRNPLIIDDWPDTYQPYKGPVTSKLPSINQNRSPIFKGAYDGITNSKKPFEKNQPMKLTGNSYLLKNSFLNFVRSIKNTFKLPTDINDPNFFSNHDLLLMQNLSKVMQLLENSYQDLIDKSIEESEYYVEMADYLDSFGNDESDFKQELLLSIYASFDEEETI